MAKTSLVAVILAVGMILSASLLSKFFVRIRHEQAIVVKGYAEQNVVSDIAKFGCSFSARGTTLQDAYDKLVASRNVVGKYLEQKGFVAADIVFGTITTSKVLKRDAMGKETNEIEFHDASQSVVITSGSVKMVQDVATGITELIRDGIDICVYQPAFLLSDLKDTKVKLLAEATRDGYQRAMTLAENSGGRVGALISAQQGVFQITEPNSTDISGYGEYDTSTIEKTAKAIVTLEYAIESRMSKR